MKKAAALLLALTLVAVLFAGCGNGDNAAVLGTWAWEYEGIGDVYSFTFREDGSCLVDSFGQVETFTYTVSGTNIILEKDGDQTSCSFRIEDNTMTLTYGSNEFQLTKR